MKPIDCRDSQRRRELIEFLEDKGYSVVIDKITNRELLIESKFPILINSGDKTITMYHTVTCAAAAASSGSLISVEKFYNTFKEQTYRSLLQ